MGVGTYLAQLRQDHVFSPNTSTPIIPLSEVRLTVTVGISEGGTKFVTL